MLLHRIFNSFIRTGTLRVTTKSDTKFTLGDGSGKPIAVRFTSLAAELGVLLDPELNPEAYMEGTLVVEEGSIADVVALGMSQDVVGKVPRWLRPQSLARHLWRRLQELSRYGGARKKVAHHYNLDGPFYSLFLDADHQYSCAYFEAPDQSLEEAQLAKKRHIAAKLLIKPGSRVLDIGSGWGGMAFYLAEICGAGVTGLNLSREQVAQSKERADEKSLQSGVEFRVEDYRQVTDSFDRIVSVEMIEYIGPPALAAGFCRRGSVAASGG